MNKVEVEVFKEDPDVLIAKMDILFELLLPYKFKLVISESLIPYPIDTDYSNCSTLEMLKKEINRFSENTHYLQRTLSVEGGIEKAEFVSLLEKAGFLVFRELEG